MFDSQIKLSGKHAAILKKYSKDKQANEQQLFTVGNHFGKNNNIYIFDTMINCYMCAAMIGIIEKSKKDTDNSIDVSATIFAEMVIKNRANFLRIYQHIIFTNDSGSTIDGKIKKAFSVDIDSETAEKEIASYARGGLEIIDDYFNGCSTYEDVANRIYDFFDQYKI